MRSMPIIIVSYSEKFIHINQIYNLSGSRSFWWNGWFINCSRGVSQARQTSPSYLISTLFIFKISENFRFPGWLPDSKSRWYVLSIFAWKKSVLKKDNLPGYNKYK